MVIPVCQNSRVTQLRLVGAKVTLRDTRLPVPLSGSVLGSLSLLAEHLASLLHEASGQAHWGLRRHSFASSGVASELAD